MHVTSAYRERVTRGDFAEDPAQLAAAAELDALLQRLGNARRPGLFRKPAPVRGLYIWGGVGRGKSMLMDLFFEAAPVLPKRRVHFHAFMGEVHDRLAAEREASNKGEPIKRVAATLAGGARLLCFDEFQVTQIADAMILGRLFDELFAGGVVVVATSNRHPDTLYEDGINRALFVPFIERLKAQCEIFELASARDYRLDRLTEAPVWYVPLGADSAAALDRAWNRLTLGAAPQSMILSLKGRKLEVSREAAGVARFTFDELCARPLGALDYLAIAATFHTLILEGIPVLTANRRDEAARFVSLIDALYESRVKLVASAAAEPGALYPAGDGAFEFQRTVSRLFEMRSASYMADERRLPVVS